MRLVVQRVENAAVSVGGKEITRIGRGVVVLAGFTATDADDVIRWMAQKISSLRLFEDEAGKMNRTLEEIKGEILVVPQFTLYGDCRKGRRPSFDRSAPTDLAEALYEKFFTALKKESPCPVVSGVFQEYMKVSLVNDGPVTLIVERETGP